MTVQGTLYIVSAPSGAGKSSLLKAMLTTQPTYDAQVSISHTTRAMRPGEQDGRDYYFVTTAQFKHMIATGTFLEYAKVYDHYYGTSRAIIDATLDQGIDLFLDIDWQGAKQVRQQLPTARTIFILPPSKEELERRLRGRGQDNEQVIKRRMCKATTEIAHYNEYDYLIINDDFDVALHDLKSIIRAERLSLARQKQRHDGLICKLLAD